MHPPDRANGTTDAAGRLGAPKTPSMSLVFFPRRASAAYRRRRWLFLLPYLLASCAVLWPVFPAVAGGPRLIFGLPLAMVWVVVALLVTFVALLLLYRADAREADTGVETGGETS